MPTYAILLAAGRSERFGADKLSQILGGKPVWQWSLDTLLQSVDRVGVVCSPSSREWFAPYAGRLVFLVEGGESRQASVEQGIRAIPDDEAKVVIHDAARPLLPKELVQTLLQELDSHRAVVPILPVSDTIRTTSGEVVDRSRLSAMQTPQGGYVSDFRRAYAQNPQGCTDDIAVLQTLGIQPYFVPGDPRNLKLTTADDLLRLNAYLTMETRTGLGYDVHAFSTDPDRPMWLGGVEFDDRPGLDGHSDADALLHAVVDALLGAIGAGDIGEHYPNTDPRWKNCPSLRFLEETGVLLRSQTWDIVNVDCSVIAERPKVLPRRNEMCEVMARALGIDPSRVSVKATTNERLGAIGRGEGIAAFAIATVRRVAL